MSSGYYESGRNWRKKKEELFKLVPIKEVESVLKEKYGDRVHSVDIKNKTTKQIADAIAKCDASKIPVENPFYFTFVKFVQGEDNVIYGYVGAISQIKCGYYSDLKFHNPEKYNAQKFVFMRNNKLKWYKEKIMVIKASSREEALAIETGINGRYSDMSKNMLNLFD